MKFGLFTHVPWPEGEQPARLFAECVEQAVFGEQLGFHSVWIAEHHFSRYSLGSSSLVLAAAIASRTERIRLGTGVLIPTLHNPRAIASCDNWNTYCAHLSYTMMIPSLIEGLVKP